MFEEPKGDPSSTADAGDTSSTGFTRRELFLMGNAVALPALFGGLDAVAAAAPVAGPLTPGPQIYQSIGVEPVINCRGTFTIIGGSVERPEVRAAMDAASRYFVQIDELADAVGRRLAELTGAEWGMVSAGCAAGMKHVTAACVTGGNPEKLIRIPDLTDLDKTEVVVPRSSRNAYRPRHPQHRREDDHRGLDRRARACAECAHRHDLSHGRQRTVLGADGAGGRRAGCQAEADSDPR